MDRARGHGPAEVASDGGEPSARSLIDRISEQREVLRGMDLAEIAVRLGAILVGGRLQVRCLGRRFEVDADGGLHSELHVNGWVHLPILRHLVVGQGRPLQGRWTAFAELDGAADWARFFAWRCERGFARLSRRDFELLFDLLDIFGREPPAGLVDASLREAARVALLEPLPGVALLVRGWPADGDFDAELSLLYDRASTDNVDAASIYTLTQGLVEMLTRLMRRHGAEV